MEKHFFEVADIVDVDLKAAHVVVEEVVDIVDVDEEVVQEFIDYTKESSMVLYLSFHVHDAMSWNWYSPDAFRNQDLSYMRVVSDC